MKFSDTPNDTIVERTWGPNAQAPDTARPRLNGPLEYWVRLLTGLPPLVARLVSCSTGSTSTP
jgi:hypothetical protein